MPLQPGIDGEASGCGIHAGDVLAVVDVLRGELVPVVPMKNKVLVPVYVCTSFK